MKTHRPVSGFTLVEVLVSIAVIAVLALVLFAGFKAARTMGTGAKCMSNLRQVGVATSNYLGEHRGWLPVALEKNIGGSAWDGDNFGAWYWNLAPYLNIERWTTVRKYLGPQGGHLWKPIVLTCPSHGKNESMPIKYPSIRPVSYAPSLKAAPSTPNFMMEGYEISRLNINQIPNLPNKIWVSDSPMPSILNTSAKRWNRNTPDEEAWARQAFTRHAGAGNALFFDGHVERIPYEKIMEGTFSDNVQRLFGLDTL